MGAVSSAANDSDDNILDTLPSWQPPKRARVYNVSALLDRVACLEHETHGLRLRNEHYSTLYYDEVARCDEQARFRREWEQLAVDTLKEAEDLRAELDLVTMRCFALEDKVAGLGAEADRLAESIEWVE